MESRYVPVKIFLIRPDEIDPNGYCAIKSGANTDAREAILRPGELNVSDYFLPSNWYFSHSFL